MSSASTATNGARDLSGYFSVNQLTSIAFTAILGAFISYYNNSWFTFLGAGLGIGGTFLVYFVFVRSNKFIRAIGIIARFIGKRRPFRYFVSWGKKFLSQIPRYATSTISFLLKIFLGKQAGTEATDVLIRVCKAEFGLWKILRQERPDIARRLLYSGLCSSPAYYLRWGVLGLWVGSMISVHSGVHHNGLLGKPHLFLDLCLGMLIGLSATRETLRDIGRQAMTEAEEIIHGYISTQIHLGREVVAPGQDPNEAIFEFAELQHDIRDKEYSFKAFGRNGWAIGENLYNLFLVSLVILAISRVGAILALCATISIIPSIVYELISLMRSEQGQYINRARRRSLLRIAEDPRWKSVIRTIAPPGGIIESILNLTAEISSTRIAGRIKRAVQKIISLVVFFTLFALSCWFPVSDYIGGGLSLRVTLLYVFSMLGLWYGVYAISEKASTLFEKITDLDLIDRALQTLSAALQNPQPPPGSSNPSSGMDSSALTLNFRFGYPFQDLLLRTPDSGFTVPPSIGLSEVVKVVGRPGSGRTSLLRILAGQLRPTFGSIAVGDQLTHEHDMSKRVLLIPDLIPPPQQIKILELFQAYQNRTDLDLVEVEEVLRRLELLDEIKRSGSEDYTGGNLLVGYRNNYLNEDQNRLLFLALQYAAIKQRLTDREFNPRVLAIDGVHRLSRLKHRQNIVKQFKELTDELHATLIVVIRDPTTELENDDWVITVLEPDDFPPAMRLQQQPGNVLTFGRHRDRFGHTTTDKRLAYRNYLKAIAAIY